MQEPAQDRALKEGAADMAVDHSGIAAACEDANGLRMAAPEACMVQVL